MVEQFTDPARELAELCQNLCSQNTTRGDDHVASCFGVSPWSQEFFQIIFCITNRIDFLIELVPSLELDEDFQNDAIGHLKCLKQAFTRDSLANNWRENGNKALGRENSQPIKMLSGYVRKKVRYPKLSDDELEEVLGNVNELEAWLKEHQMAEQDFIRQAILDGLTQFKFRLERLGWLGWGYTLQALREVVSAYLILNGLQPDKNEAPDAVVVLKKVNAFLKDFYLKAKVAKEHVDTGDFLLRMYGALAVSIDATSGITGFIAN